MTTRQAGRKGGLKRGPTKARKTAAEAARRRGVMARRIRELEEALKAREAENKAMRDRVAELDTELQGAQSAIRRAYEAASAAIEMRAAGNALARHVAEDTRGQTARQLVQAWKEAAQ